MDGEPLELSMIGFSNRGWTSTSLIDLVSVK
jgi:hypothetical protein